MLNSAIIFSFLIPVALCVACNNGCVGIAGCPEQANPCTGNYCTYLREITIQPGAQYNASTTKRSCSDVSSLYYGDGSGGPFTLVNSCVSVVINNIDYHLLICNNQDYCNHDCTNIQQYYPTSYYPTPTTTPYYPYPPTTTNSAATLVIFVPIFLMLLTFV